MGYSTTKIPFMVIDNSTIEVHSATHREHFNLKKLSDLQNFKGGFLQTDKEDKSFIFEFANPDHKPIADFIEFTFK